MVTKVTQVFYWFVAFFFLGGGGVVVVLFGDVVEVKLSWCTSQGVKESRNTSSIYKSPTIASICWT